MNIYAEYIGFWMTAGVLFAAATWVWYVNSHFTGSGKQ